MDIVAEDADVTHILLLDLILIMIFSARVLSSQRFSPISSLSWVLSFILIPFFSIGFFLLVDYRESARRRRRRPASLRAETEFIHKHFTTNSGLLQVAEFAYRFTKFPVLAGNRVEVYIDPEKIFEALASAIRSAKSHIHLEYYLFRLDEFGESIRKILAEKAREGVECRLLVDDIGSYSLSWKDCRALEESGIRVARSFPVKLSRPLGFHFRNHRKLVVVDGQTAFMGSQNIGQEYWFRRRKSKSWKDLVVKIQGKAVEQLQTVFAEDWGFSKGENLQGAKYFPENGTHGQSLVQILPTGPDENERVLEMLIISLCHYARKKIILITPYFVPTEALRMALATAVMRGVSVEVMIPVKTDYRLMDKVQRAWLNRISSMGVKISLNGGSLLHSKVVTFDGEVAVMGSANMDERSFRLNFELSALFYDRDVVQLYDQEYARLLSNSTTYDPVVDSGFYARLRDGVFRIFSPLF